MILMKSLNQGEITIMANKYSFWKDIRARVDGRGRTRAYIQDIYQNVFQQYHQKYYNVWMTKFKWSGLDDDCAEQEENFIMRKLWSDGTVALRNIENTDMIAAAGYATNQFNIFDFPEIVTLVKNREASDRIIPEGPQVVNKDVAILYCLPSHEPVEKTVDFYCYRIAQVELVINNNLKLHNNPFLISCTEENKQQMTDIVDRILNNELVIFSSQNDISNLQALLLNAPYLIDKLKAYQVSLENELLTILGIDNSGVQAKKAQMLVDEVNANNDIINDFGAAIEDELKSWLERANKVLNRNISIEAKTKPVDTTKDFEDASITEQKQEEEA